MQHQDIERAERGRIGAQKRAAIFRGSRPWGARHAQGALFKLGQVGCFGVDMQDVHAEGEGLEQLLDQDRPEIERISGVARARGLFHKDMRDRTPPSEKGLRHRRGDGRPVVARRQAEGKARLHPGDVAAHPRLGRGTGAQPQQDLRAFQTVLGLARLDQARGAPMDMAQKGREGVENGAGLGARGLTQKANIGTEQRAPADPHRD